MAQELLTLLEHLSSPPVFSGVRLTRSLVLYVCSRSLFVLLCFFLLPLCCLLFDIQFLIAPLVFSNSSCELQKIVSALIIVEGWHFATVNHCGKVSHNSFLSFQGQGLKLRVCHWTITLVTEQSPYILTVFCNGGVLRDSFISLSSSYYYYY
jgi:hypothetical protein